MQVVDLSLPLSEETKVFPGDPKPVFSQICFLKTDDWNVTRFSLNTHDATHINVPVHAKENGKTLDDYDLDDFIGEAFLFNDISDIHSEKGIIFSSQNITLEHAKIIIKRKPKFVGLSGEFEFDLEVERLLLENDIISFENLINTHLIPKQFMFYGIPLRIVNGDGSPVRAFATF